ncbi:peptidoglycan editing factor PgeF [bacterium]|nr:peptidoglycan editing factor PgeF [bacterium]
MLKPQILEVPQHIKLGFSTKPGGLSQSPFQGLNMSTKRGDSPEKVNANRHIFLDALNLAPSELAQAIQISRDNVQIVTNPGLYIDQDALITRTQGVVLSILTADCTPILLWSMAKPLVAAVHSGWQGSELDVLGKTLQKMIDDFGVSPTEIYMVIGPGLSKDHFEVGPEFETKFPGKYLYSLHESDRFQFDNNCYLYDTALKNGIPEEQIEVLPFCTFRDEELFFSHRRDKGTTGRMMSVIGIKE